MAQSANHFDPAVVAAVIAFAGVLVSASVAFVTASRSVYVNAITAARIRWIERVRDLTIEFSGLQTRLCLENINGEETANQDHYQASRLYETLKTSLGDSRNEQNVVRLAACCLCANGDYNKMVAYTELLHAHTRWLLNT